MPLLQQQIGSCRFLSVRFRMNQPMQLMLFPSPWNNQSLYIYPPTNLLVRIVRKLASEPCQVLLIAPFWPSQPWFWDLVHLATDRPRALPSMPKLLKQPGSNGVFDKHYRLRRLHVWPIDTTAESDPHFQPSSWLQLFRVRKLTPPAVFASQQHFSASSWEVIAFWLDTDVLA